MSRTTVAGLVVLWLMVAARGVVMRNQTTALYTDLSLNHYQIALKPASESIFFSRQLKVSSKYWFNV